MAQFLTPKAVCAKIALSRATLDRLVDAGKFPAPMRISERRIAFTAESVDEWMNSKMNGRVAR